MIAEHDLRLIFSTCAPDQAESLARALVEERLVGCVNVVRGVESFYTWNGAVEHEQEVVLFMETRAGLLDAALTRLRELHAYQVPKILVFRPSEVHEPYHRWLAEVTGNAGTQGSAG